MRYSLRTLLIVFMLAGVLLARVGYLKRMGDFHRQKARSFSSRLLAIDGRSLQFIQEGVQGLAEPSRSFEGESSKGFWMIRNDATAVILKEETISTWKSAIHHQRAANAYDRAIYRPWTVISDSADDTPALLVSADDTPALLGLDGYCPVTLMESKLWQPGRHFLRAQYKGALICSSAREKAVFESNPDRFTPVQGGDDVVRLVETGKVSEGNRRHGLFGPQGIYLFDSEETLTKYESNPQKYEAALKTR